MDDLISRQAAIDLIMETDPYWAEGMTRAIYNGVSRLPSVQPEIILCRECKYWMQQTNYEDVPLSFGFCQSDDMWRSLYGETCEVAHIDTDDDFYCGYAKRRTR